MEKGDTIFTSEHSRHLFYPHPWGSLPQPTHHIYQELHIFKKPVLSEQTPQHKPKISQSPLDFHPERFQAPVKPIHKPREIIITPRKLVPQSPLYNQVPPPPSHLTFPGVTTLYSPDTDSDKEIAEAHVKQILKPREIITKPHKTMNSVSKPTRKRHLLSQLAIRKHIHPECNTNQDAVDISEERDRFSRTDTNHVFKIRPTDFEEIESV